MAYATVFPHQPVPRADDRWLEDVWVFDDDQDSYIKRVMTLFPDAEHVLHLFAGNMPPGDYVRFDLHKADINGNAHHLSCYFPAQNFDLVVANPSCSDSTLTNNVLKECAKVLKFGGFVVWLDRGLPTFPQDKLQLVGLIGVVRTINHRVNVAAIFQKPGECETR